jgi:hypothetical protein
MDKNLDIEKVELALKRVARTAVTGDETERAGRYRLATVYFVRDGTALDDLKDWLTNEGVELPLEQIAAAFPQTKVIWSKEPPIFKPELSVNPVSDFQRVVVHVRGGEPTGQFTKDGYWILDGVTPAAFGKKFPKRTNPTPAPS